MAYLEENMSKFVKNSFFSKSAPFWPRLVGFQIAHGGIKFSKTVDAQTSILHMERNRTFKSAFNYQLCVRYTILQKLGPIFPTVRIFWKFKPKSMLEKGKASFIVVSCTFQDMINISWKNKVNWSNGFWDIFAAIYKKHILRKTQLKWTEC